MSNDNRVLLALQQHIRIKSADAPGLLVPISGGSDGALAFYLCATTYPTKTLGLHFGENLRCQSWFESIGRVEIQALPHVAIDAESMRWALLQDRCYRENFWAVGSRNRSEQVLGTYSRPSEIASLLPLVGLWKSDVMDLCRNIGIPAEILRSSRNADPVCGRPQSLSDIGIERIDDFLKVKANEAPVSILQSFTEVELQYLEKLFESNSFKVNLPIRGPLFQHIS